MKKNKKGAASFYVVAFSTLILVIIAASFATIIISEITRTSNDDLAQSAYDSALAGVEDAKLAFATYEGCLIERGNIKSVGGMDCDTVMDIMALNNSILDESGNVIENNNDDPCDMVSLLLGRGNGEVKIAEVSSGEGPDNAMDQAYTCVKIATDLKDYRASLSSSNPVKLVPVKLKNGADPESVRSIEIHWYSDAEAGIMNFSNFNGDDVIFPSMTLGTSAPPTIGVTLIQTAQEFKLDDFEMTHGETTDRGTVYLVPTNKDKEDWPDNKESFYKTENNYIKKEGFLYSNDKTATNQNRPYLVYCDPTNKKGFLCSATIELPEPVNGSRNKDTFFFAVSLPYGRPATSFLMEFCNNPRGCWVPALGDEEGKADESGNVDHRVYLSGSQISVDSTGRANDLYKRVDVRLEPSNTSFPFPLYGIQLLDPEGDSTLLKDLKVTSEHNF